AMLRKITSNGDKEKATVSGSLDGAIISLVDIGGVSGLAVSKTSEDGTLVGENTDSAARR
ncbi:hypothetical protein, partial [Klebsiella pneumoniae]|uniref:hypothetical protein n=1 Tax=Klebsiella pneumoniae TaxID=573 RepID=UPI0025A119C7